MKTFDDTLQELRTRKGIEKKLLRIEMWLKDDENAASSVRASAKKVAKEWNRIAAGWFPCEGAVFEYE